MLKCRKISDSFNVFVLAGPENGTIHQFKCDTDDPLTDYFFDFDDVPRLSSYNVSCTDNG